MTFGLRQALQMQNSGGGMLPGGVYMSLQVTSGDSNAEAWAGHGRAGANQKWYLLGNVLIKIVWKCSVLLSCFHGSKFFCFSMRMRFKLITSLHYIQ